MVAHKGVNRYPRRGDRVAPTTLRQLLLQKAPKHLVGGIGGSVPRLCDLDETVWEKLAPETIKELSRIVVARVAAGCSRRSVLARHCPRPPEGTALADLRLEHRTHFCLAREGFEKVPARLGDRTIGEILAIRSFGPRCLIDLLSSLETLLARGSRLDPELTAEAKRLGELSEAALVNREDPRFGPMLDEVDLEAPTAEQLAERLIARPHDPPDPRYATGKIRKLRERILQAPALTLEEELIDIFASTPHQRNREIVMGYYGWKDGRRHTLAEIGARHGMTRERTRQICAKLVKTPNPASVLAPVTDRALALIADRLPASVPRLEEEMVSSGLTAVGLRLGNVLAAAKLLGRAAPFAVVPVDSERLAVRPEQVRLPPAIAEVAKKENYYHGAAAVGRIRDTLSEKFPGRIDRNLVVETVRLLDDFRWLEEKAGWFRLVSTAKHGLPKAIDKVLAVAGRITPGELRAAVSRNRRLGRILPPESVLLEFCRQTPGVRIEDNQIIAEPKRNWKAVLTGVEAKLVDVLQEHGPVMERGDLEDLCLSGGVNRFSFHAFIASSPVIAQFGHSVYGLLGADVSTEAVKSLAAHRRSERAPVRVLHSHGQTEDGKLWLSYRLSKAASTYAVITVPGALKDLVSGRFRLLTRDGRHVGTLAAKDGRAWGLGAFLRQSNAQVADTVCLTIDLEDRTAVIALDEPAATAR